MDRLSDFEELYDDEVKAEDRRGPLRRGTEAYDDTVKTEEHRGQSGRVTGRAAAGRVRRTRSSGGRKRGGSPLPALLVIILFSIALGALGYRMYSGYREMENSRINAVEITEEQERLDGIRQAFSDGDSTLSILRKYYPEDLVLYYDSKYSFYPVDDSLRKHAFDPEKVRKNTDGTWGYVDGDMKVEKGIDVSAHQGEIDWEKVAGTNITFAMIRLMYRGYETGRLVEDKMFRSNIENAAVPEFLYN